MATDFDLAEREQQACWLLIDRAHSLLRDHVDPDGFTVGFDVDPAAEHHADHAHLHLLPRQDASTPEPGIQTVIPNASALDVHSGES